MGLLVDITMWTELPVSHNEYIPYKNAVFSESQVYFQYGNSGSE